MTGKTNTAAAADAIADAEKAAAADAQPAPETPAAEPDTATAGETPESTPEKVAPKRYTGPKVGSIAERDYFAAMNADGSVDVSTVSDKPVEGYGVQLGVKGALVTPELARVLGDDTPSKPLGV